MKWIYLAIVVGVIDGDTIDVSIDLGFDIWHRLRVRVKNLFCPEITGWQKEAGVAAKEYAEMLLPIGCKIILETFKRASGADIKTFDRYVGTITINNIDFSKIMFDAGHGILKEF